MPACGYEFYLLVFSSISHEFAALTREISRRYRVSLIPTPETIQQSFSTLLSILYTSSNFKFMRFILHAYSYYTFDFITIFLSVEDSRPAVESLCLYVLFYQRMLHLIMILTEKTVFGTNPFKPSKRLTVRRGGRAF